MFHSAVYGWHKPACLHSLVLLLRQKGPAGANFELPVYRIIQELIHNIVKYEKEITPILYRIHRC